MDLLSRPRDQILKQIYSHSSSSSDADGVGVAAASTGTEVVVLDSTLVVGDETVLATAVEKVEAVPISTDDGALVATAAADETTVGVAMLVMGVADEAIPLATGAIEEATDAEAEESLTAPPVQRHW
jgi:hypothetical protein